MNADDLLFLRDVYTAARFRYRPAGLQTLLLAEAPPENPERFFYYEDVKRQDSLFLEIMGVLYPREKEAYLKGGRRTEDKTALLRRFQAEGFWLWNFYPLPASPTTESDALLLERLLESLEQYVPRETPIILIKTSVYDSCYAPLRAAGYNAVNRRLPYPGSGQQGLFREGFRRALDY
ncbi:hypothetical protein EPD60_07625 [Flaviaesturariibacter flavus]|uniref:Uncharacterized protein n=1 Tax=Flaviaesturariibacter flavus TaxID=2502780 RepID=A0A4R1BGJ4_9BACT|nr:hypothetical protein [Flaviaesturariibacter flavus]TCJ16198.1 hypothetical protein EPD60_07625 [Flaviaesturariibacter flavus]